MIFILIALGLWAVIATFVAVDRKFIIDDLDMVNDWLIDDIQHTQNVAYEAGWAAAVAWLGGELDGVAFPMEDTDNNEPGSPGVWASWLEDGVEAGLSSAFDAYEEEEGEGAAIRPELKMIWSSLAEEE